MDKLEYIKMVDEEILPSIREKLVSAFESGVECGKKEVTLEEYLKSHNLSTHNVYDFGLRSGIKFIFTGREMRFEEAQKLGLQFPTYKQACELCNLKYQDGTFLTALGPNGKKAHIKTRHEKFCVWFNDSVIDSSYNVKCNLWNGENYTHNTEVYSGQSFKTVFVLPEYLQ